MLINTAAYTEVDLAESEQDLAYAINQYGSANLADFSNQSAIPLIHLSTDYVFDGFKKEPYSENDAVEPLGIYGQSKEAGESEIRQRVKDHLIIRTAWLYGIHGNNFVKTMLNLGKERETIKVVDDQSGCPTYAADLADAILTICDQIRSGKKIKWGTYHYCGEGSTTWYEFAIEIFKYAYKYEQFKIKEVIPIATEHYPTPVKRPPNVKLDCSKIERNFGVIRRPWLISLSEMIESLYTKNDIR
jgi:dTDP-4-dehydrorhamnose reductase